MGDIQNEPKRIALKLKEQLNKLRDKYQEFENSLPLVQAEKAAQEAEQPLNPEIPQGDINFSKSSSPVIEPIQPAVEQNMYEPLTNADVIAQDVNPEFVQPVDLTDSNQGNVNNEYADNDSIIKTIEDIQKLQFEYVASMDNKLETLRNHLEKNRKKEELFSEFGVSTHEQPAVQEPFQNDPQVVNKFPEENIFGSSI